MNNKWRFTLNKAKNRNKILITALNILYIIIFDDI